MATSSETLYQNRTKLTPEQQKKLWDSGSNNPSTAWKDFVKQYNISMPNIGGTNNNTNNNSSEILPAGITKSGNNYRFGSQLFSSLAAAVAAQKRANNPQANLGTPIDTNIPAAGTNPGELIHTAPNGKTYTIKVDPITKKATFISQGGMGPREFNNLDEAISTINSANAGVSNNTNALNSATDAKNNQGNVPGFTQTYNTILEQGEDESDSDFKMRQQKQDQYDFIASAGDYLSKFTNSQDAKLGDFTKNIQANAKMLQDKLMLETENALAEKAKVQASFDAIKKDFDTNQQKQWVQLQSMESQYLADNKTLNDLQNSYYNDLTTSVGKAAGGASAGTRAQLSSLGVDEGMINTALNQVNNVYQDKLLTAKNDHIDNLTKLRDSYQTFYQSMINNETNLNTAQKDLAMTIQEKVGKYDTDITQLTSDSITAQYKPLSDSYNSAMASQIEGQASEAKRQETEKIFQGGTPVQKAQMLYDNLARAAATQYANFAYDTVSLDLLKEAATLPSFTEALQYIVRKAAGYTESTGKEPAIVKAIGAYHKEEATTSTTPPAPSATSADVPATPAYNDKTKYKAGDIFTKDGKTFKVDANLDYIEQ